MTSTSESSNRTTTEALQEWSLRTGIKVEIWAMPAKPLPTSIAEIVHGTIEEVLQEVERQAHARTVSIVLTVATGGLRLTISDDGYGRASEAYEDRLHGRRVAFRSLGGALSVNSVPGEGTTVRADIPAKAFA
ncbi:hypothetical protein [Nonomuraea jiangxiensis]|uniref:histidine kinase n=1 Tax=Nonomuraea jiangxiensis TaxID=633440 RepID=A0A1G8HMM3_9ACTN|nr:hypothetical protein [Nonomuraea jiangxiensis]SDI07874.1 hypothetical protein SAMN05421869_104224 [Nonomuraea jiangxiensis]